MLKHITSISIAAVCLLSSAIVSQADSPKTLLHGMVNVNDVGNVAAGGILPGTRTQIALICDARKKTKAVFLQIPINEINAATYTSDGFELANFSFEIGDMQEMTVSHRSEVPFNDKDGVFFVMLSSARDAKFYSVDPNKMNKISDRFTKLLFSLNVVLRNADGSLMWEYEGVNVHDKKHILPITKANMACKKI